jgi:hypothetical protein
VMVRLSVKIASPMNLMLASARSPASGGPSPSRFAT